MLTRVAESLYWIGRNIERCEHCSRYLKVQYFSTLDAPMSQNKDFTLRSILFMSGSDFDINTSVNEGEVWQKVIFDYNNPNSIANIAQKARENAKSIRNNLSTESWEAINKFHLFMKGLDGSKFNSSKVFQFSEKIILHLSLINSTFANTLLHTNAWSFINLGIYIERNLQILRILKSKISDITILTNGGINIPLMHYQWITLLKSLEAFDVYMNINQRQLSTAEIYKLIISNELFPRSVIYSGQKIKRHLTNISARPLGFDIILANLEKSIDECIAFQNFDDEEKVINFINQNYENISRSHLEIQKLYF